MRPTTSSASNVANGAQAAPRASLLTKIFLAALALRWIYALAIYAYMGDAGLKGVDSIGFERFAVELAGALKSGVLTLNEALGTNPYTMPVFHWLAGLPYLICGNDHGALAYVLLQGVFDAATCVIVYAIALRIVPRIALAAAIFAIINPTQIVMSGLFYADTPFTTFVALAFLGALMWADAPTLRNSALLGASLGLAALIRAIIVPWAFFALVLLAIYGLARRYGVKPIASLALALVLFSGCVGAILFKNYRLYGTAGLTPQAGIHLALWVVPLAKEMQDRTPYAVTFDAMEKKTLERFGPHPANYYEQSRQYSEIAREALKDIPFSALAKSWLSGMAINLASPAVLLLPPVSQIPRTGFVDTPGHSFGEKVLNYTFRSSNAIYSWLLVTGAAGLAIMRAIQLIGFASLARRAALWPALFLMLSWVGYILLVNGPIASPKYRLPLEPLFNVVSGAGLIALADWRGRKVKPATAA
jgi:4-amino-4-deoxy-L-arabinose transferase-like glycosyltransferase